MIKPKSSAMNMIQTTCLLGCLLLSACSTTHSNPVSQKKDPLEAYNRAAFGFNDALDKAVLKPVAKGYVRYTPRLFQMAANNFFSNIDDVVVTVNDLLQFKFKQAASDGSRVLFNTTFGLFGLIEVTSRLEKHHEDFGQTLGYWGVPSGPYLIIPVLGPSSLRDGTGLVADSFVGVLGNIHDKPTRYSAYIVQGIVIRASFLEREKMLESSVIDRYTAMRDAYIMHRENLVYDGNPPRQKYEDFDDGE